jgi:hypothetical protein
MAHRHLHSTASGGCNAPWRAPGRFASVQASARRPSLGANPSMLTEVYGHGLGSGS